MAVVVIFCTAVSLTMFGLAVTADLFAIVLGVYFCSWLLGRKW